MASRVPLLTSRAAGKRLIISAWPAKSNDALHNAGVPHVSGNGIKQAQRRSPLPFPGFMEGVCPLRRFQPRDDPPLIGHAAGASNVVDGVARISIMSMRASRTSVWI